MCTLAGTTLAIFLFQDIINITPPPVFYLFVVIGCIDRRREQ
jgi:hypothetical protein